MSHLFDSQYFMPHGHCYLWRPDILWLNVGSDALIALSYYAIPASLIYLVSKRKDLEFDWIFVMFALFILACGTTHVMEIWTVWYPQYALEGLVKLFTAAISATTAIALIPLMPKALAIPNPHDLERLNEELRAVNVSLEKRVEERTRDVAELAAIVQYSNDTIIGEDTEGTITSWNPAAVELFGYTEKEAVGMSIYDLVPEDRMEEMKNVIRHLNHDEASEVLDTVRLGKGGRRIDVSLRFSPLKDSHGKVIGSSSVVRDITARKMNDEKLQRSEALFKQVIEAAPNGILMVDQNDLITLCNAETEKIFGYSKSELIGKKADLLLSQRLREENHSGESFFTFMKDVKTSEAQELCGLRKNGTEFPIEIGLSPIKTFDGNFMLASVVDISRRKFMENRIQRSASAIQQKNQEMEQFVYTVSHDLKSPLVTSSGFLGLLKEDLEAHRYDQVMDSVERLENANSRMGQLINDLLQLSRIGRIKMEIESIHVDQVVQEIFSNLSEQLSEKNIQTSVQKEMPVLRGDKKRVYQIFENLIINAIKYAGQTPNARIEIGAQENRKEILYYVRDNGPGIAKEYHKKIFGLFQRLENDNLGTGVGLAIVSRAMQLHGGRAWVESEPDRGATFWLSFPKDQSVNGDLDYES